ncbi:acyl--CoA ligase [Neorhizobium sp. BETTINA12A]|uniref:class I adenylate-forming enzyme family protein n=1 Tax=Neorhizobium sp. BETTINA12A TaxID=2908924 RepID=UPI001FF3BF73|nr:class I adenylate-forming enzyme family protein [Neorhizobium sp. BETTINA12A]MCJ9750404.1 acyl--CoA ligase [Neorhizobium sp. BETTINA12A]
MTDGDHENSRREHQSLGAAATRPLIPDVMIRQAQTRGSSPYLTAIDPRGAKTTITFAQLDRVSADLAGWLARHHGVRPGSVVALCPINCIESVVATFALMRSGAVTLMLNPADPPNRHALQIEAVSANLLLRSPSLDNSVLPDALNLPFLDEIDSHPFLQPVLQPWNDTFLIGTSGSTAASKIVRQTHGNAAANARDVIAHHRMQAGETFLGCLPIHHVNGLHFTLLATLLAGCHANLLQGFDPIRYPLILAAVRPRIASVVPSILDALTTVWRDRSLPDGFDYFVSAAAALTSDTARAVYETIGARIVQGYGLSETTNFSCTMPPHLSSSEYRELMFETRIPPVGIAVCNEIAIVDDAGRSCPDGTAGELMMRGPNVTPGYYGNGQATQEAFRNGWFHSGDLGYTVRSPDGKPLFVLTGRSKNIAKVRGESVSLDEMDRELRRVPGVRDAACISRPDKRTGEAIVAAVVCDLDMLDDRLIDHLRSVFSPTVLPSEYVRVSQIPRTPTGKVLRPGLAKQLLGQV